MTTIDTTTDPTTAVSVTRTVPPLARLAGLGLAVAPVLLVLGAVTSPPQESDSNADYVASLAADRFQTAMSANFFHYSFVLWAFGLLAVVALVPGRRGRTLTTVLAGLGAVSSVQMSGLLLTDAYLASIAHHADVATGAAVLGDLGSSVAVWLVTGQVAALFVALVPFALARAGVVRWWLAPLPLVGVVVSALPLPAPVVGVLATAAFAPYYLAAYLLVRGGE